MWNTLLLPGRANRSNIASTEPYEFCKYNINTPGLLVFTSYSYLQNISSITALFKQLSLITFSFLLKTDLSSQEACLAKREWQLGFPDAFWEAEFICKDWGRSGSMWVIPKVKSKGRCKLPCVGRYEIHVSQGMSKENAAVHSYGTTTPPREIQTAFKPVSQLFTDGNSCDLDQDGGSSVWTARGWTLSGSSRAFGNKQGGIKGRCCPGQGIEEAQQPSSILLCTRLFPQFLCTNYHAILFT